MHLNPHPNLQSSSDATGKRPTAERVPPMKLNTSTAAHPGTVTGPVSGPVSSAAPGPRRLPGAITFNRTSRPDEKTINAAPSKAERAWLMAAERLTHDLLTAGVPDSLAAQTDLFATAVGPVKSAFARHGLDRRGAGTMEAAARYLVHHAQPDPALLTFVSTERLTRWCADQDSLLEEVPGDHHPDLLLQRDAASAARLTHRQRVLWANPAGIEWGLMVDRFHHTSLKYLVPRDGWVRRKVMEDLGSVAALVRRYVPEQPITSVLYGVRVLSHRATNEGIHFTPVYNMRRLVDVGQHALGECAFCRGVDNRPNQNLTQATR
jgi:hypothetical protein